MDLKVLNKIWRQIRLNDVIKKVYLCRKKAIALTFDDGQGNARDILQSLEKYYVKATFFITGETVQKLGFTDLYNEISALGHELANHTYSHCHITELSDADFEEELERDQQFIEELGGHSRLFRFPYGENNERLIRRVAAKGLYAIGWSIDSRDWEGISSEEIYHRVMDSKELRRGGILLLHTQGKHTAEALDLLIPRLQTMGYELMTVSRMLEQSPIYRHFRT